jgi:hypothetical protein
MEIQGTVLGGFRAENPAVENLAELWKPAQNGTDCLRQAAEWQGFAMGSHFCGSRREIQSAGGKQGRQLT